MMISEGPTPERISMPNLIGKPLAEARQILQDNNLVIGSEISRKDSNAYYADYVIDQDTQAGVLVDEDTTINLTVSSGPGPAAQTRTIELRLPEEQDFYKVVIKVKDAQGQREVYDQMHNGGDGVVVGVSYFGTGQAEVFLNGKSYQTFDL